METNNSHAGQILKNAGPFVRIFPLPGKEEEMTAQLFALAERLYGTHSGHIIDLVTSEAERPYIRVGTDLAEAFMRGVHKIPQEAKAYDPGSHSVADVLTHLYDLDEAGQQKVLEAEAAGKARKTILGFSGR